MGFERAPLTSLQGAPVEIPSTHEDEDVVDEDVVVEDVVVLVVEDEVVEDEVVEELELLVVLVVKQPGS